MPTRRNILSTLAASTLVGVAGCTGSDDPTSTSTPTPSKTSSATSTPTPSPTQTVDGQSIVSFDEERGDEAREVEVKLFGIANADYVLVEAPASESYKLHRSGDKATLTGLTRGDEIQVYIVRGDARSIAHTYSVLGEPQADVSITQTMTDNGYDVTVTVESMSNADAVKVTPPNFEHQEMYEVGAEVTVSNLSAGDELYVDAGLENSYVVIEKYTVR